MENNRMLEKENSSLKLRVEGITSEYQYVLNEKNKKIFKLEEENRSKEKIIKDQTEDIARLKSIIEAIENSRIWKLRNKIKGIK